MKTHLLSKNIINLKYLMISIVACTLSTFFVIYSVINGKNSTYPVMGYFTTQSIMIVAVFFLISTILNIFKLNKLFKI